MGSCASSTVVPDKYTTTTETKTVSPETHQPTSLETGQPTSKVYGLEIGQPLSIKVKSKIADRVSVSVSEAPHHRRNPSRKLPHPHKWASIRDLGEEENKRAQFKTREDSVSDLATMTMGKLLKRASVRNLHEGNETKWEDIFGSFTDGIIIINTAGTIQYANESLLAMFEYDELDEKDIRLLVPNFFKNIQMTQTIDKKEDKEKEIKHYQEYQTFTQNGQTIYVQISYGKFKINPTDKHYGFLISFKNITENKLLEQKWLFEFKRNDALIASILPAKIIQRIKNGEQNIYDKHDSVVVGFCDIVKFTDLCNVRSTAEIIDILNTLFTHFDALTKVHQITKIETIGDCYMIASGLFGEKNHAERAVRFMSDALKFAESIGIPMRAGLDVGPILSGVIGTEIPHFSLFGPTVNKAARMESNGTASRIHVTQEVVDLVEKIRFAIKTNGSHDLKGFGTTQTFLIEPAILT